MWLITKQYGEYIYKSSCYYQSSEEEVIDFMQGWNDGSGVEESFKKVKFELEFKGWEVIRNNEKKMC